MSCLTGDGPLVGEALATHPGVAKVAFTGSRRVAEQIAGWAAPRLKALSLELGGHGALVVLPDADLDVAAEVATMQGYVNSGQACYAVNRVLVPPAPGRRACSSACAPASPTSRSGRWPPSAAWRATACCSRRRRADGARVEGGEEVSPGRRRPGPGDRGRAGGRLVDEEPFTPIVAVMETPTSTRRSPRPTGPTTAWSTTSAAATCAARSRRPRRLQSGTVVVNGWRVVVPYAPYAGWRGSGVGAELGRPGLEAFVHWQHLRVLA